MFRELGKHMIFIGGLDRSGTTMLASLLGNINRSLVIPESPFKFFYLDPKKTHRVREYKDRKYFFAHGFDAFPEKNELITYLGQLKADFVIDHTPKNRFFVRFLLKEECLYIHIRRKFTTLCMSHKGVSWGTDIVSALYWRWFWDGLLSAYRGVRFKRTGNYIRTSYEKLLLGDHEKLINFLEDKGISVDTSVEGTLLPKKISMPGYTKSQHRKVGEALDKDQLLKFQNSQWDLFKVKVFLFSLLGPLFLPFCIVWEIASIWRKVRVGA